ncbi:MAG: stage III sporulation protein AF [Alicyclobacillus sp.]|nr:stage III sporulation protein AF [Alicyclobacillus sp.]
MIALGAWLKQIILIVMLAVFTDLLLPSKSMQRYVRTVLGLAIIAAILQPIVPMLRKDWADHLAAAAIDEIGSVNAVDTDSAGRSPPQSGGITADGVRSELSKQAATAAERMLAEQLLAGVRDHLGVTPMAVSIALAPEGGPASITIHLPNSAASSREQVRTYLAHATGLPRTQVHVVTEGGVSDGP